MTARRLASVLAAVLTSTAAGAVLAPSAVAASGYCPRGAGATVVVDRGSLGGGTSIGCDPAGANTSASTVVPRVGFPITYVARQPGFVCRVAGLPDASRETCGSTPPSTAYWGLFWSDGRSGTWTYASVGVGSLRVPAGGFIGWRFQDGGARSAPSVAPVSPRAAAPSPRPKPSPSPSPTRRASAAPKPTSAPPATRKPPAPTSSPKPPASTSGSPRAAASKRPASPRPTAVRSKKAAARTTPSTTPSAAAVDTESADPTAQPASASPAPTAGDLSAGERAQGSSGPGLPLVAGGLLVALLTAAGVLAWRRRGV